MGDGYNMCEWTDKYAMKFLKPDFNEVTIINSLSTIVEKINKAFIKNNVSEKALFNKEEKLITLPDCFISYKIEGNSVLFSKLDIKSQSKIECSGIIKYEKGYYIVTQLTNLPDIKIPKVRQLTSEFIENIISAFILQE